MSLKIALVSAIGRTLRPLFPQRSLPDHPQAIIVIKPCCLGDVVLATPAIAALKNRYPEAAIDVAVGRWSRAVLENNPHLRRLLDSGRVGQGPYGPGDLWQLARQLRRGRYELAVVLDRSPLLGLLPWLAGIPHRLGLDSFGRGFAHSCRVRAPAAARHEALLYLDCVAATGQDIFSGEQPRFRSEFQSSQVDREALPAEPDCPFVILHPAGGLNPGMQMPDKRWPLDRLANLADRLAGLGYGIVLSGAPADRTLCREVAALMQVTQPWIAAGEMSLGQFGALCRRAALFVGGDTGAMHLAVACGCKTVAIFGPSDPQRYAPFAPPQQAITLWQPLALPGGGVGQGRVRGFSWENGVTVDQAWQACLTLLPDAKGESS